MPKNKSTATPTLKRPTAATKSPRTQPRRPATALTRRTRAGGSETAIATRVTAFPSKLGWMATVTSGDVLKQLTFGHRNPQAAIASLDQRLLADAEVTSRENHLTRRLQAYAEGAKDDFLDVPVDVGQPSSFQSAVLEHCRRIPFGSTLTYGELARLAGSPGAARAVGNVMASNRIPLVIPCHRVVGTNGGLGGYSASGGTRMKLRMLELEATGRLAASRRPKRQASKPTTAAGAIR